MQKFAGDILFGLFVIVMLVIFLRRSQEANNLISGVSGTLVSGASQLSQL